MKKERLREILEKEIEKLLNLSIGYASGETAMHEVEKGLLKQVLAMCLEILKWIIQQRLNGLSNYEAKFLPGTSCKSKGMKIRDYLSIFGSLKIMRPSHWSEACGMFYKLDESMKLPLGRSWSYNLQEVRRNHS